MYLKQKQTAILYSLLDADREGAALQKSLVDLGSSHRKCISSFHVTAVKMRHIWNRSKKQVCKRKKSRCTLKHMPWLVVHNSK